MQYNAIYLSNMSKVMCGQTKVSSTKRLCDLALFDRSTPTVSCYLTAHVFAMHEQVLFTATSFCGLLSSTFVGIIVSRTRTDVRISESRQQ